MAYAALLSLSNTIELILGYHQDSISSPAKDQIVSIANHVVFLQAFLEDFPAQARRFEAIIRAVTRAAEDIVEVFMSCHIFEPRYASLKSSDEQDQNLSHSIPAAGKSLEVFINEARRREEYWIRQWLSGLPFEATPHPWTDSSAEASNSETKDQRGMYEHLRCYDFFQELKEAKEELESLAEKIMKFKNSIVIVNDITAATSFSKVASSHKHAIISLDDDLLHIKSTLCRESHVLEVVPIVGMGGIGKTVLARNVYDDQLIMHRFDIRAWVTVSQDYSVRDIVSSLLASMKVLDDNSDAMKRSILVFQSLKFRRFLIVLDDIWSRDVWDEVKLMFPNDGNGSRIILTTRLQDVASYADSGGISHKMRFLNKHQSWNLLQQTLFKHKPCPTELERIGKTIARRCRGLPLAVKVISGVLSSVDQSEATWNMIAEDVKSVICSDEEHVDKILSLSYMHLPPHLKTCLLYIAGFPEDYTIRVTRLIRLLMAEGYVKPSGAKSFEETGEEYLEDLVKRSLVLVIRGSSNGSRIKSLSMHDLIREMCIKKAQQENFFSRFLCESRTISLYSITKRYLHDIQLVNILGYYRLLRILDLKLLRKSYTEDSDPNLPSEVCELFHLRYLAFDSQFRIPAGLSNLQNLLTFVVYSTLVENNYVYNTNSIPFVMEIWRMPQLRHIHIGIGFYFCLPRSAEGDSFALENLQTLSFAINFACTPDIVKAIPNVKKLVIFSTADQLNNLRLLQKLEILKLEMMHTDFPSSGKVIKPAFPHTLKNLTLRGLELPWEDMWIVSSLPNLEVLKLRSIAYGGDTWETTEGGFPQLKLLLIDFTDLENWITESSHFPRLQSLVIYRYPCLKEIPDEIGEIPTLELIEVDKWNDDVVESAKQIQQNQLECGNDSLRVRIVKALPVDLR